MRTVPPGVMRAVVLTTLSVLVTACATVGYYGQAVRGQFEVIAARRPIDDLLRDPHTAPALRHKLLVANSARSFASAALGLPDNASYKTYADLGRPYVVWNVFAAPPFSLELRESCFLLVGCLSYRGYFDEAAARGYAAAQQQQGQEVYVGGVAAYSTLGWFADPVLNSMLKWSDTELVKTIFHELAHQLLYVNGDSTFNESFATAVAEYGFERWREETESGRTVTTAPDHEREIVALLRDYRTRFAALYASGRAESAMRAEKARLWQELARDYASLKRGWGGDDSYDDWMRVDMNNAKLAAVGTYHDHVDAFMAILHTVDCDLARFYAVARRIAALAPGARAACLDAHAAGHPIGVCPGAGTDAAAPAAGQAALARREPEQDGP